MSWRQMNGRRRTEVDGIMWIPKGPSSDISCNEQDYGSGLGNSKQMYSSTQTFIIGTTVPIQNNSTVPIFLTWGLSASPSPGTSTFNLYCDSSSTPNTAVYPLSYSDSLPSMNTSAIIQPNNYFTWNIVSGNDGQTITYITLS